jgi:hypothetical protein
MLVIRAKVKVVAVVMVDILPILEAIGRTITVQKEKSVLIVVKLIMWLKIAIGNMDILLTMANLMLLITLLLNLLRREMMLMIPRV